MILNYCGHMGFSGAYIGFTVYGYVRILPQ